MKNEVTHDILKFILGGKATFAIVQDRSDKSDGGIAWYHVNVSKDGKTFFVSGLGAGNSKLYQGYWKASDLASGNVALRVGSKQPQGNVDCKPLLWVVNKLLNGGDDALPSVVHVVSDAKCSCCGRTLTDLNSTGRGIGPDCYKKLQGRLGVWGL